MMGIMWGGLSGTDQVAGHIDPQRIRLHWRSSNGTVAASERSSVTSAPFARARLDLGLLAIDRVSCYLHGRNGFRMRPAQTTLSAEEKKCGLKSL